MGKSKFSWIEFNVTDQTSNDVLNQCYFFYFVLRHVCVLTKQKFNSCTAVSRVLTDPFVIYSSDEPDAKKAKGDDEEEEYNLADIAEGSVTSVSGPA